MGTRARIWQLSVWAGLWLVLAVGSVHAQTVQDIRAASAAGHTRAVLGLSAGVDYTLFQLDNPARIVIDFEHAALGDDFKFPDPVGSIKDVRTGRHGKHGLRVVLDLDAAAQPKSFLLRPDDNADHYRLVVDLYSDPVLTATKAAPTSLPQARDVIVVVDAGHGGDDPGAIGARGTYEKDITLKVAKCLAEKINAQPGMKAVLTRDGDSYIPLKRRYQIAREHNADLFVSIHADAFRDKSAHGSSVWVLSRDGKVSEAARWLARDNPGMLGGVALEDTSNTLARVLLDLSQVASIRISNAVASNVLNQLADLGPTHKSHVERANFVVLRSPDVPSVLVETGFITNPREERLLLSTNYRQQMAGAIVDGVMNYFLSSPPAGTWLAMRARQRGQRHVVTRGETLSGIARNYGVELHTLQQANHLANINNLQAGAVLTIPTS